MKPNGTIEVEVIEKRTAQRKHVRRCPCRKTARQLYVLHSDDDDWRKHDAGTGHQLRYDAWAKYVYRALVDTYEPTERAE